MPVAAFTWEDLALLSFSVFLLALGFAFAYMLVRVGGTFARLSSLIEGTERELLPVINKVGGSVDRVNGQLDKIDTVTDSAVDAADSLDTAVRAVTFAIARPVQKLSGWAAGLTHGAAALRARRGWRNAVETARTAAVRREQELAGDLQRAGEGA